MVVGDAHHLPFRDGAFQYSIARHVLEHLDAPAQFLTELARVSDRGYIETPSAISEQLHGYPFHKWLIAQQGHQLVLRRKQNPIHDPALSSVMGPLNRTDSAYRRFCMAHPEIFLVRHEWERSIDFTIAAPEDSADWGGFVEQANTDDPVAEVRDWKRSSESRQSLRRRWRHRAKQMVFGARMGYSRGHQLDLIDLLSCPRCRGDLTKSSDKLTCGQCAQQYEIVSGVPILLYRR